MTSRRQCLPLEEEGEAVSVSSCRHAIARNRVGQKKQMSPQYARGLRTRRERVGLRMSSIRLRMSSIRLRMSSIRPRMSSIRRRPMKNHSMHMKAGRSSQSTSMLIMRTPAPAHTQKKQDSRLRGGILMQDARAAERAVECVSGGAGERLHKGILHSTLKSGPSP